MLYKPNFCCQCGDKIERVDWKLTSSRRFCDLCKTEFSVYELLPRIGLALSLILGIFFIGGLFQVSNKTENNLPNKLLSSSQPRKEDQISKNSTNQSQTLNLIATPSVRTQTNSQSIVSNQGKENRNEPEKKQSEQIKKTESVYFCGAETKKGTPCTRRVKGGGRCWQHTGKAAMLPENQLSASQ